MNIINIWILIEPLTIVVSVSFLSQMFLFFHVEDNGILVEYAYSFLR